MTDWWSCGGHVEALCEKSLKAKKEVILTVSLTRSLDVLSRQAVRLTPMLALFKNSLRLRCVP